MRQCCSSPQPTLWYEPRILSSHAVCVTATQPQSPALLSTLTWHETVLTHEQPSLTQPLRMPGVTHPLWQPRMDDDKIVSVTLKTGRLPRFQQMADTFITDTATSLRRSSPLTQQIPSSSAVLKDREHTHPTVHVHVASRSYFC